jgi:hypothetical protein
MDKAEIGVTTDDLTETAVNDSLLNRANLFMSHLFSFYSNAMHIITCIYKHVVMVVSAMLCTSD